MRLSAEAWAMGLATATAARASCLRRNVGCVLLDSKNRVLATGYNGPPACMPNCSVNCIGMQPNGADSCLAVHAEINALMQCNDIDSIHTIVVTCFPCFRCAKALLNTPAKTLIYKDVYTGYESTLDILEPYLTAVNFYGEF